MPGHKTVFNPSFSNTLIPEFSAAFIIEPVPLLAKGTPSSLYPADTVSPSTPRRAHLTAKKLSAHRVYIRRPAPASEEPKTAEEWDRFFERCLQNRRAELLEAMRSIMTGVIPDAAPAIPTRFDELKPSRQKPLPVGKPLLRRSPGEITAIAGAMLAGRLIVPSALAAKSKK
jgi:hypothetical protein